MDVWVRKKEMEENTRGLIPLNLSYVQKKRVNQNHKKIEVNLKKTNMLFQKSKKLYTGLQKLLFQYLRIFTGKKHPETKLKHLRKV